MRIKEVFLNAPEEIMTPEFRQYVTENWNDTEQLPTTGELADTLVWLIQQDRPHISKDVQMVLIKFTEAAIQHEGKSDEEFELAFEQRLTTKQ